LKTLNIALLGGRDGAWEEGKTETMSGKIRQDIILTSCQFAKAWSSVSFLFIVMHYINEKWNLWKNK